MKTVILPHVLCDGLLCPAAGTLPVTVTEENGAAGLIPGYHSAETSSW